MAGRRWHPVALVVAVLSAGLASPACTRPRSLARLFLDTEPRCSPCSGAVADHVRTGTWVGDERGPFETWKLTLGGGEIAELRVPPGLGLPLPAGATPVVEIRHEREEVATTSIPIIVRERLWVTDRATGEILWAAGGGTAGRVDIPGLRAEIDKGPRSAAIPIADPCGVHTMRRARFVPDPGATRAPRPKLVWPGKRTRIKIGGHSYRVAVLACTTGPDHPTCPGYVGTEFSFVLARLR